jgi:hypothetical protein
MTQPSPSDAAPGANDHAYASEQWWLAPLGDQVVWARLRVLEAGTAEVFDCDGRTQPFEDEDTARGALLDAEFRALDGLDEDDAAAFGVDLATLRAPEGDDETLRGLMIQRVLRRD